MAAELDQRSKQALVFEVYGSQPTYLTGQQRQRYPAEISGQDWPRQKVRNEAEAKSPRQQSHDPDGNRESGRNIDPLLARIRSIIARAMPRGWSVLRHPDQRQAGAGSEDRIGDQWQNARVKADQG